MVLHDLVKLTVWADPSSGTVSGPFIRDNPGLHIFHVHIRSSSPMVKVLRGTDTL